MAVMVFLMRKSKSFRALPLRHGRHLLAMGLRTGPDPRRGTSGRSLESRTQTTEGSPVLVLDLAYKPNVDDDHESPIYRIMELLKQGRAEVSYYDPYVPVIRPTREHPQWGGNKVHCLESGSGGRI
jgi:hypothetical protein